MGENERKTKTSLASFHSKIDLHIQSLRLVFEAIPPLYNYQITITMSNLEWQNGKKTKSTKSQQKPENFAVQEDFATLRKFCNAGNFRKVAKILQTLRNSQFTKMARIFTGVAKIAKMTASLFLASAASRLCSDDLFSTLFLH